MELWIRSQDKTKLVKADNIVYMDSSEDYEKEVHSLWNDCKGILGTYKTKERALEVLDEIMNLLKPKTIVKSCESILKQELADLVYRVNPTYETIQPLNVVVYEMPKD